MITSIWAKPGEDCAVALELRRQVFQDEFGLSASDDQDGQDSSAYHLVLCMEDRPVAAGRLTYEAEGRGGISRVCVLKPYRRQGIGDGLVRLLDYKAAALGLKWSTVDVLAEVMPFYQRMGYHICGGIIQAFGQTFIPMEKETNDGTSGHCAHQCSGEEAENGGPDGGGAGGTGKATAGLH